MWRKGEQRYERKQLVMRFVLLWLCPALHLNSNAKFRGLDLNTTINFVIISYIFAQLQAYVLIDWFIY